MQAKLKECFFCEKQKKIFKNTPEGPQCIDCWRFDNATSQHRKQKLKERKKEKRRNVVTEDFIDSKFSVYIRLSYSIGTGSERFCKCYTCDEVHRFSKMQCGHFIPRAHKATRWLRENGRPQCFNCNVTKGGNLDEFRKRLEAESPGLPDKLEEMKRQKVWHPTEDEKMEILKNIISETQILFASK